MSDDLIDKYRTLAAGGEALRGLTVLRYADDIKAMIDRHRARTLLDYGCGAGDAYREPHKLHEKWGVARPTPFDPAFPKYARPVTGEFDGVLCVDVLEHLTEGAHRDVLDVLFNHADLFLFVTVCCRPAHKHFPDGTNLHTLVRPFEWWTAEMEAACARTSAGGLEWQLRETP